MMVSGARKGFWGVPPYERLGGRGVVSVPQMVKGRSLRLIALGVLLCCALALGGLRRRTQGREPASGRVRQL